MIKSWENVFIVDFLFLFENISENKAEEYDKNIEINFLWNSSSKIQASKEKKKKATESSHICVFDALG